MKKGKDGTYSITMYEEDYSGKQLVVDAELVVSVTKKLFSMEFELTNENSLFIDYLKKSLESFDEVTIVAIKYKDFYEEVINKTLGLPFTILDLQSEKNYKTWLWVKKPVLHVAIYQRKNYFKTSVTIDDLFNRRINGFR
jgi:hypothetical protein